MNMQSFSTFVINNWTLFLALVVILVLLARTWIGAIKSLRPLEALTLINRQGALVLDVRSDKEFQEGHILNAMHIPLGVLSNRMATLEPYKSTPVIVACRSGARSAQAAGTLKKQGFEQVFNLSGGVMAWQSASLPVTTEAGKPPKPASPQPETTAATPAEPASKPPAAADEAPAAAEGAENPAPETTEPEPPAVVIYTTALCPYCTRAIELLKSKGAAYTERRVDGDPDLRQEMERRAQSTSVPQIFVGDHHVGGCDELYALDEQGKLDELLALTPAESE